MKMESSGLYIHLPFCIKRCKYCSFVSSLLNISSAERYVKALVKEIEIRSRDFSGRKIDTIYIGGGTPTALSEKMLEIILISLKDNFNLKNDYEFTIEANPGTLNQNILKFLKRHGINRLSIGAQAFQPELLKTLGRIHSQKEIFNAVEYAKEAGFSNLNIDLLFAVPGQTLDDWKQTLNKAVELDPEHISMYGLTYEHGTDFFRRLQKGTLSPLDPDIEFLMYRYGINFLQKNKFKHYEISNFAKKNKECRHNLLYWKNREYLGIGSGAVSYLDKLRLTNSKNIYRYIDLINNKSDAVTNKERIFQEKQIKETIILNLRLAKGLSKKEFKNRFGITIESLWPEEIAKLYNAKLIINTQNFLRLTRKGIYLNNEVLNEFM